MDTSPRDNGPVAQDPEFRPDLYRGTASYYDRFRLPYPQALIADLAARAEATGHGRLLDLACGTGQISFALLGYFPMIWAVDQEPDMTISSERRPSRRAYLTSGG